MSAYGADWMGSSLSDAYGAGDNILGDLSSVSSLSGGRRLRKNRKSRRVRRGGGFLGSSLTGSSSNASSTCSGGGKSRKIKNPRLRMMKRSIKGCQYIRLPNGTTIRSCGRKSQLKRQRKAKRVSSSYKNLAMSGGRKSRRFRRSRRSRRH